MGALTLSLEAREHTPGTAVALHPGDCGLYASYDPAQISEADAVRVIGLIADGCPDVLEVCTADDLRMSSVEGIAKHGGSV
jgi:hypothetical protein